MSNRKWIKAKRCESNGCAEAALDEETNTVYLRSSLRPTVVVDGTREQWNDLVDALRTGEIYVEVD